MKLSYFIAVLFFALSLISCEQSTNYSKLLEKEQKLIDAYIEREGYTILDEFPKDSVFGEKEMYHYPDGIYIQLLDKGHGEPIKNGESLILRYKQSTLDIPPIVEDYWTTQDRPYPNEIVMGDLTYSCEGWQAAFDVMLRTDSHALVIIPSQLGRDISTITPYLYEMKILAVPK